MTDHTENSAAESSPTSDETRANQRRWPWFAAGGAALLAAGIGIAAVTGVFAETTEPAPPPVAAPTETPIPTPTPTPTPEPEPEPTPLPDPAVAIPSVQQMAYSPVWNPPDDGQYFWQIVDPEHGYPQDGGTDFLLAHACESQQCAGDELRKLEVGDTLTYLGETFVIEDKREIMKVDIASQDIWFHDPDRIVIITCIIETTWDQSDKNDLFIATRYVG